MGKSNVRQRSCCFTGHRPEKLKRSEEYIRASLRRLILQAIDDGFDVFISGMARGVDIWAAEEILALKSAGYDVKLVCAVAFDGMEKFWAEAWRARFNNLLSRSDLNCIVCKEGSIHAYIERNEWMVDRSSRVIAVYDGSGGGTARTIKYAENQGVDVYYV